MLYASDMVGRLPIYIPLHCACGELLSVNHAMCCHKGGFPTLRHNEIRDMSANLLREVCPNTCTEPSLQPLNSETFQLRTANMDNEARMDIRAEGFWTSAQVAFFDIRVLAPHRTERRSSLLCTGCMKRPSNVNIVPGSVRWKG